MITELEKERDEWREVYEAFVIDTDKGIAQFESKNKTCGLCVKYKTEINTGEEVFISCRECPIVIISGRTCNHWWGMHGIAQGKTNTGSAALTTYLWLKDLIEKYEAEEVN